MSEERPTQGQTSHGHRDGHREGHSSRKARAREEKSDRSKESLERKVEELQHRLDEERQAARREKLSLARLQREMARQNSEQPMREGLLRELECERMLRSDTEQRLREMTIENDSCQGRLRALQEEFRKMEEMVSNMMQYKVKIDQLKQEKASLSMTYECNLTKYRSHVNSLERENMMLLNEVKKMETQTFGRTDDRDKSKVLLERLKILEAENSSLVLENEEQRQQYEKCLDEIANQVVQALLGQKTLREECMKLQGRVQDLELQNQQLNLMFQHKNNAYSSDPMLQSFPIRKSRRTGVGFDGRRGGSSRSITSLPSQYQSDGDCMREPGVVNGAGIHNEGLNTGSGSSLLLLRQSIDSIQSIHSEHMQVNEDFAGLCMPQMSSPPSWLKDHTALSDEILSPVSPDTPTSQCSTRVSLLHDSISCLHSNSATPVSPDGQFRIKIETEFPASCNASPKMKHVGVVSCPPMRAGSNPSSANHSRASSLSALSISSSNQNLSISKLNNNSGSACVSGQQLHQRREEGVKSPGWEWVSPTGSRDAQHGNPQAFLSPIDDFSDDDSVRLTNEFSSASTVSLNELLDDSIGVEVEDSELEDNNYSVDNFAIPSLDSSGLFSASGGLNSFTGGHNSLSGMASLVQVSSPDSDSGVHTPCVTSPVKSDDRNVTDLSLSTSPPFRASASLSMHVLGSCLVPERPQSLELRPNPSTSSLKKNKTNSNAQIPKKAAAKPAVPKRTTGSIPISINSYSSPSLQKKSSQGQSHAHANQSKFSSYQTSPNLSKKCVKSSSKSETRSVENSTTNDSMAGQRPVPVRKNSKSCLPVRLATQTVSCTADLLPVEGKTAVQEKNKSRKSFSVSDRCRPDQSRSVVIASAVTDPPCLSSVFKLCASSAPFMPGIDTTPGMTQDLDSSDHLGAGGAPVYKQQSISSDSSSENIRVERSGSKDDGYSTMSSDVHPETFDRFNDVVTVKRNTSTKPDYLDTDELSPGLACRDEVKSPPPVRSKPPPKPPPRSQMPVPVRSQKKSSCPPTPPPKPARLPVRRVSRLPVPSTSIGSPQIRPKTSTPNPPKKVAEKPQQLPLENSPCTTPVRSRVKEMARLFESVADETLNKNCVKSNFASDRKRYRNSFHGDFNRLHSKDGSLVKDSVRHSYDGSTNPPDWEKFFSSIAESDVTEEMTDDYRTTVSSANFILMKPSNSVVPNNDDLGSGSLARPSPSTTTTTYCAVESLPETCARTASMTTEHLESETTSLNQLHQMDQDLDHCNSTEFRDTQKVSDYVLAQSGQSNFFCQSEIDSCALCSDLPPGGASLDSPSPLSDSSQESLTPVKFIESENFDNYLLSDGDRLHSVDDFQKDFLGFHFRDERLLDDITEESEASQGSHCENIVSVNPENLYRSVRAMAASLKKNNKMCKKRAGLHRSLSDSELLKRSGKLSARENACCAKSTEMTVSIGAVLERSVSLTDVGVELSPLSTMSLSLRRSPCQLLIDEDTMSQKAAMLVHREHFSDDVYNYSSDSESDIGETINFLALWHLRPSSNHTLPDWNPKQTANDTKLPLFSLDVEGIGDSRDADDWLLQFSKSDIERHLSSRWHKHPTTASVDSSTESREDRADDPSFDRVKSLRRSHNESPDDLDDGPDTEDDLGVSMETQTCFRREFYSLCRVESNKSLCSGSSSITGSDVDVRPKNLTSANPDAGQPAETDTSKKKMAEFDKISRQIAALSRKVGDLHRSLSSLDSIGGSSGDLRLDDFQPSSRKAEPSSDGFHWVEDDEFYLAPCSGEVMVKDARLLSDTDCGESDWMNDYAESPYHDGQEVDFHSHLQLTDGLFSQHRYHGDHVLSPEDLVVQDPETRASLLDAMLGPAAGSVEDRLDSRLDPPLSYDPFDKHSTDNYFNGGKRKGRLGVVKQTCVRARPSVDFMTFYTRYEEPEKRAVSAFDFLDDLSTSSSEEELSVRGRNVRRDRDTRGDLSSAATDGRTLPAGNPAILNDASWDVQTNKQLALLQSEKVEKHFGVKRGQTPKVVKQATNLTKRLSNGSLESQENISTESLTFSDSCCETFSQSSPLDGDLSVL